MDNKTRIRFYSGLDTIGGVIMEITYKKERILLEAGKAFNPVFDLDDGFVNKRKQHLKDCLWTNDLPWIDGVYDKENIEDLDILAAQDSDIHTSLFISHLHLDHMGNLGFFSDKVDIYMSKPAQIIFDSLQNSDEGIYNLHHNFLEMPTEIKIGDIFIKPLLINSFSYQDYSFYVETADLKLHYTGDVFVYGIYQNGIENELSYLRDKNIDICVCEGTCYLPTWLQNTTPYNHFDPKLTELKNIISEETMLKNTKKIIDAYDGLLVFNVYSREISHIQNWLDFAKDSKRQIIWEPKTAHIMNNYFHSNYKVMIPDTYDKNNYPEYLKDVINNNEIIAKKEIISNPDKYIVQNSYENILELLDYRNIKTKYLHHSGTPLGDYDPQFEKLMSVLNLCNIEYKYIYETNEGIFYPHAVVNQLLWYLKQLNPRLLVPSHCPNRKLEGESSNLPYFLCEKDVIYTYDKENNTLKEFAYDNKG